MCNAPREAEVPVPLSSYLRPPSEAENIYLTCFCENSPLWMWVAHQECSVIGDPTASPFVQ